MRTPSAMAAMCVLLLGACDGPIGGRIPPPPTDLDDWQVVDGPDATGQPCTCAGARAKYLRNLRNYGRTVGVRRSTTNIWVNQSSDESIPNQSVGAQGVRYLGCSIVTDLSSCDTLVSYRPAQISSAARGKDEDVVPLRSRYQGVELAAKALMQLRPSAAEAPLALDCAAECLGPTPGPRCILADNTANGHDTPEHGLLEAVRNIGRDGVASRADLLAAWGRSEADEPCGRGDIAVRDGALVNVGGACEFPGMFAGAGTGVSVNLPEGVLGQYEKSDTGFSIAFPNAGTAPSMKFDNPYLDYDFGGPISRVEQTRGHFVVTAPRACLALRL